MLKLDIQMFADGKVTIQATLETNEFKSGLNQIENLTRQGGNSVKSIVAGLGITKMISVAMSQITSSIEGAVARLDTLNNFPRVMSNLGVSTDDAEESIQKMSKQLSGLPTTLDEGAMAVQRFTSANGDVKKSTDIFLALNNALLAGGASADIQSTALEQISQAYAKGKPDMMEWRSMMTAMPAQLKQVANAMGYVSSADLGEALREDGGEEEFQRFIETIVQLNEEGVEGFQSFEEQARNSTGGLKTSIVVAKTQVVKGVADIIDALNKGLEDAGLPNIQEIITNIGKTAKEVLDVIADKMPAIIWFVKEIGPYLLVIYAALKSFMIIGQLVELIKMAKTAMMALNVVLAANPIGLVVAAIVLLIGVFVILWNKCEWFREGWKAFFRIITDWAKEKINNIVSNIKEKIEKIKNIINIGHQMYAYGKDMIQGFINGIKAMLGKVGDAAKSVANKVKSFLHFSKPDEGPLRDYETWMPDMIKGLSATMKKSSPLLEKQSELLANDIQKGFNKSLDTMYNNMQGAITLEQSKLQANVETGKVFNSLQNSTPIAISLDASVEMDSQKVGRLVTPSVARTIKNGGGV